MINLILILALSFSLIGCLKGNFQAKNSDALSDVEGLAKPSYGWEVSLWSSCSANACGTQGTQSRSVVCKKNNAVTVADSFCSAVLKPATSQSCSAPACAVTTTTLAPTTTTLPPVTSTTMPPVTTTTTLPPVSGVAPITILPSANIETAGILITLPAGSPTSVSAKVYYKKAGESTFQEGHPFTRYDANNMATSLFSLSENTTYDLRVDYRDAAGVVSSKQTSFRTQSGSMLYPAPLRVIQVSHMAALQAAVDSALPGDHIVMASGVYSGRLTIANKAGTAANPIVIRGASAFDPFNPSASSESHRAIIDGNLNGRSIYTINSAHIVFDNIEVRNGGGPTNSSAPPYNSGYGIYLNSSSRITIQNSYIHDNGQINIYSQGSGSTSSIGGILNVGYHRIQNNFITDTTVPMNCPVNQWDGCSGITYEGIQFGSGAGGNNIIRKNRITNHIDNATMCSGSSNDAESLSENEPHALKQTSVSLGKFLFHNTDVYENEIHSGLDDEIEADGVCVNLKAFNNALGLANKSIAHHAITASALAPGPAFFTRNVVKSYVKSALKLNTGGSGYTRNVYVYHNTFVKIYNSGAMLNLWYGGVGSVAVKNVQFKNNIFFAPNGGRATDINTDNYGGPPGTILNFNSWFTPTASSSLFEWFDGSVIRAASSLSGFRTISGQEANGMFVSPDLNSNYSLNGSSPLIDRAVRIPGINNIYNGSAPDVGAKEY